MVGVFRFVNPFPYAMVTFGTYYMQLYFEIFPSFTAVEIDAVHLTPNCFVRVIWAVTTHYTLAYNCAEKILCTFQRLYCY